MDKYEVAKELGIDLEHLEKIGKEFREAVDRINNSVITINDAKVWLDNILVDKEFLRTGKLEFPHGIEKLTYIKRIADKVGTSEERMKYIDSKKKEYRYALSVVPFVYKGKKYIFMIKNSGKIWLYDVSRYGKLLGMGKEKFSNITYYPEIDGDNIE